MYDVNNIKLTDVRQTKAICDFKITEDKHCTINADIRYNKIRADE
jgi:hypothetical protein